MYIQNIAYTFKTGGSATKVKMVSGILLFVYGLWYIGKASFLLLANLNSEIFSGGDRAGWIIATIIGVLFYLAILMIGLHLFTISIKIDADMSADPSVNLAKKSKFAILYPWAMILIPSIFVFYLGRNNPNFIPGLYFILFYLPITIPLALIATLSRKNSLYIINNTLITVLFFAWCMLLIL